MKDPLARYRSSLGFFSLVYNKGHLHSKNHGLYSYILLVTNVLFLFQSQNSQFISMNTDPLILNWITFVIDLRD